MAYVYNGSGYRGGGTGVENDFDIRKMYAQMSGEAIANQAMLPTAGQIGTARQDLGGSMDRYNNLADNGMYSPEDMSAVLSSRVQQVNNTTNAMQQSFNAQQSQRGLGSNAGVNAAVGMAGKFAAAGQRGQAYGDLMSENAQSKIAGIQGGANIAGDMAKYAAMPTQQNLSGQYAQEYDKWRNAQVGYNGAQWGTKPNAPAYYNNPVSDSRSSTTTRGYSSGMTSWKF